MIETQFACNIKGFQSNGGGEFMVTEFIKHLETDGIIHQLSCAVTPEQNGVVERKHGHIVETSLTNLSHKVPSSLSVDTFATIVLITECPQYFFAEYKFILKIIYKDPQPSFLKVFGCQCFSYLRYKTSNKFNL